MDPHPDTTAGIDRLFDRHRRPLWAHVYRLTGCAADADEIVQETFLRALGRAAPGDDESWRRWLFRVGTNLGIDTLRRRRRRAYAGPWLPSPIDTPDDAQRSAGAEESAEARYERRESLSFAFLVALEALTPRQRAVLLLRDVCDYSAREAGSALRISEENVRITHLRARRAMQAYDRARCRPTPALEERTRAALERLLRCLLDQDTAGLEALLAESVRTVTDGGGEYTALKQPMVGRRAVMTLHLRVARRRGAGARVTLRTINGLPALLIEYARAERRQAPRALLRCELGPDGRIAELHTVLAGRKLTAVHF